jgi:site-specific DNA recombinase
MKAIIYTRVSSDEQVKGTSLNDQEARCKQYCADQAMEVLEVFREEGASAKTIERRMLLEAMEYCRKSRGRVDTFVVWKVDRFARNAEDHFAVRKLLLEYGVSLRSVTEPIGEGPAEKLFETMLAGFAEFDNAIRKQRCSNGMQARVQQGIYPWKPPVGYKPLGAKRRGEKKNAADPPDERTFAIIQRGLKEYAKGTFTSQTQLAKALDEWGLREVRGRATTGQLVDKILGQYLRFYAGILVNPWTGEDVEGLHAPMITRDEMHQIMLIRSGKARAQKRNRYNADFPLRRTVRCATCGRMLTGSVSRGNGGQYFYYHCHNRACTEYGKTTPKAEVEKAFIAHLRKLAPRAEVIAVVKASVIELWEENGRRFKLEAERHQKSIASLNERRTRIRDLIEDGTYSREEGRERLGEIKNQIIAAEIAMHEARIEQFDIEAAITYATDFISDLGRQWFDLAPELRPRFQKLIFPEGVPYSRFEGFGTTKTGLTFALCQQNAGDISSVVDLWGVSWNQLVAELREWQALRMASLPHSVC